MTTITFVSTDIEELAEAEEWLNKQGYPTNEYKVLGCPEPPDKPRMTDEQKRIKRAVLIWIAKLKKKVMG